MLLRLAVIAAVVCTALSKHDDAAKPDCLTAGDGYYVKGCSSKFWRCVNDRLYSYDCPRGLYFNPLKRKCEYKADVSICTDGVKVNSKNVIKASAEFNCTSLEDGPYKPRDIACSNTFITCFNGMAVEQACPYGQYFHEANKVCDYKDNVPGCLKSTKGSKIGGSIDGSYGSAPAPPPQRSPTDTSLNAKAAQLNACPGLLTGKNSEGIPCDDDEVCQGIQRPKNGRYSCEAPFAVWYGPVRGSSDQWKLAREGLVCGVDGFWYDSGVKVDASGIDCSAKKADFQKNDDEIKDCPSLSTNEREIPCTGDEEVCQPILKAVAGKYACPTPYRVWYGPRGGAESSWKQAKDVLVCKSGSWFDGDIKIDATAVDCTVKKIDCSKLGDGTYNGEPGRCSTHFWQCSNEQAYLYPCPPGLFFDDFTKSCDFKEVVESCGGVRRSPSSVTSTLSPPAADPVKKTDCPSVFTDSTLPCRDRETCVAPVDPVNQKYFCETPYTLSFGPKSNADQWRQAPNGIQCKNGQWFNGEEKITPEAVHCTTPKFACSGKKDGAYSAHPEKCTSYFWNCAHDDSFLYTCPAGLFFDVDTLKCDYKEVNVACGGMKTDSTQAPKELIPSSDSVLPAFDCSNKENGYHETAKCDKKFWNCADGKSFQMDCPAGLVYDGRVQLCQYPLVCGADLPATTTTPASLPSTLDHGDISKKPVGPTTSFDCSSKPDGIYAEKKCHSQYVQCTNGRTFAKECPAGLVFTAFNQACDYKQTCMNPPTTTAPSTTPSAALSPSSSSSPVYADYDRVPASTKAPVSPPTFDKPNCANLEDGAHAMTRCGVEFFLCWHGEASFSKCNDGLVFNPHNSQCDYRSNVIECGPAADATTPTPGHPAPPSPPTSSPAPSPDLFCEGRDDGHFGSGCQSFFYSCQSGATTKMFCPVGLHYDADAKTCDMREIIVACGGKKEGTTSSAPPSSYLPVQPVAPLKDIPTPPVDKFCVGKEDGFFQNGCQNFFYSCMNGFTYKMTCPFGLFYDADHKTCDRKEDIVACGAAPSTTQAPPTTPAAAPPSSYHVQPVAPVKDIPVVIAEKFCIGKEDGFYANGCQSFFYTCQNGQTHKMACPSGLFYDSIGKKCDNKEEIVACGATPTQTPVTTPAAAPPSSYHVQPVAPVKDVPVSPIETFCVGKEDAFYSSGCQSFFISCQSGRMYKMNCPSGLFYDAVSKNCDSREKVVACGTTPTQSPVTTPAAAPPSSYHVQPVAPVKDVPVSPIETFCVGKEDAFYSSGCQSFFVSCQSGRAYKMNCPSGLFYDAISKNCDNREKIVACGATQTPVTTPAAAPPPSYDVQPVAPVKDVPVSPIETFCVGKEDAFYGRGCQSFFYSCQSGITHKMACPSGLFYDSDHKKCDNKEEIVACGATPTQTPLTKTADVPAVVVENFCDGKTDGFYAFGCQSFFYSCQSGSTYKMTCPSGLFYDATQKRCNRKEEISVCGAPATTTPAAAPAQTTQAPAPYHTTATNPPVVTANFCAGKTDNVYGAGCQNFFYSCQSGVSYKTTCSTGLFFDVDTKQCNYREFIVACGGKKEEEVPATAAPVVPSLDRPAIAVEIFCLAKEDGFYGDGCQSFFYSCQGGATYKMMCPSGLFYDLTHKKCDRKEDIAECRVAPSSIPSISLAPVSHPYSSPVLTPSRDTLPIPLVTPENFCAGKTDGFYGNGCANHFFSCQNGNTDKMTCPLGLFYDASSKLCDHRGDIVECGGVRPASPVTPAAAPAVSQYGHAQSTLAPVRDIENFCDGKIDGFYGNGCGHHFFSCQNGNTYKMICPSGLFYGASSKRCDRRDDIVECGGVTPAAPITPAAAPSQYVHPVSTSSPVRDVIPVVSFENFCVGKVDGIYSNGCESFFIKCVYGTTYKMSCPADLFYDVPSKLCDIKDNVLACGGKKTVNPVAPVSRDQPAPPVEQFCNGKADGFYDVGCESHWYSCMAGFTYKMLCPSGLFYDVTRKGCYRREEVTSCASAAASPAEPSVAVTQYTSPALPSVTPAAAVPAAPVGQVVQPDKFCSGKANGIYPMGCADFYYSCANEYTYKMACPSGLFYDVVAKGCDVREKIVACGGSAQTVVATAPAAPAYSQEKPQTQYQPAPITTSPVRDIVFPVNNFCSGKADGSYADGCQSFFFSCQNGNTYKMDCSIGLFFDLTTKQCEYREKVAACGGSAHPAPTPAAAPAAPGGYTAPAVPVTPAAAVPAAPVVQGTQPDKFCTGKVNGIYSMGCADFYYSCANGYTYKMACPSGLFYDVVAKGCDVREKIVACGGSAQTVVATAPAAPAYSQPKPQTQYQPVPITISPVRDTVFPVNNFCAGKADGSYADGCQSFFFSCQNGNTYKMDCSTGLFFDLATKQCEYREKVVACGGSVQPAPTHAAAPAAPAYSNPSSSAATAEYARPAVPAKDKPVLKNVNDRSCTGQKDGYFGEGCNSFFYTCLNGAAYKMACPTGLFYDLALESCQYKDNVPNCGGRRPDVVATPSPALDRLPPAPLSNTQCNGKKDGTYAATDCSQEFIWCQAGLVRKEACQTGLFFNEANGMCDYRENVSNCSARDTLPTRAPYATAAPAAPAVTEYGRTTSRPINHDAHKEEQYKRVKPPLAPSGTSCAAEADGYYSNGCSSDYTACVNGQSMAMHCPSGLMYAASTQMCDYSDNVPECGGSAPVVGKTQPEVTPRPVVPVTSYHKRPVPTQAPAKNVHPRCAGRPDGVYALAPCSQNYIACVDEKATIGICSDDLFYSAVSGMCDWKEKNAACTILVRPTPVAPRSVPTPMPTTAAPLRPTGERLNRPSVPLGVTIDCSKVADGVYAVNGCSPFYSRCADGRLIARGTCPKGLVFSPSGWNCVQKSSVSSCPSLVTPSLPVTTQTPALAPVQPVQPNYGVQPAQQQQQQPIYQQQQHQYGNQQQMQQPQQSYTQQYAPSYSATYGSGIYADPTQFCYGKGDGIFGNTCQRSYVVCSRGATFAYQCPGDFVFNRERVVCDHPSRMPQCGGPIYGYSPAQSYQQPSYSAY